jgi:hypothetical protein
MLSGDGYPNLRLYPEAADSFFMREYDVKFEFVKDDSERWVEIQVPHGRGHRGGL